MTPRRGVRPTLTISASIMILALLETGTTTSSYIQTALHWKRVRVLKLNLRCRRTFVAWRFDRELDRSDDRMTNRPTHPQPRRMSLQRGRFRTPAIKVFLDQAISTSQNGTVVQRTCSRISFRRRMTESRELHPVFPLNAAAGINVRRHATAQRNRTSGKAVILASLLLINILFVRIGPPAGQKRLDRRVALSREPTSSSIVCHSRLRFLPCLPGLALPSTHSVAARAWKSGREASLTSQASLSLCPTCENPCPGDRNDHEKIESAPAVAPPDDKNAKKHTVTRAVPAIHDVLARHGDRLLLSELDTGTDGWVKSDDVIPVQAADRILHEADSANPKDVFSFAMRGMLHHDKGEVDQAVTEYDQALKLDPEEHFRLHRARSRLVRQDRICQGHR